MTPREIARIEALSLQLREESLAARSRAVTYEGRGASRGDDDGRHRRRVPQVSAGAPGAVAEAVRAWNELEEPSCATVAARLGISRRAAMDRLQRARRAGLLPPARGRRLPGPVEETRYGHALYAAVVGLLRAEPHLSNHAAAERLGRSLSRTSAALAEARRRGDLPRVPSGQARRAA